MSGTPCTPHSHQRTPSIMTASTTTIQSQTPSGLPKSRFPRLQECAHFHYEVSTVDVPKNFRVQMCRESDDSNTSVTNNSNCYGISALTSSTISGLSNGSTSNVGSDHTVWFQLQVTSNDKKWNIYRTNENFKYLDKFLHDCIFDRKFSNLEEPVSFFTLVNNDGVNSSATTFKNNKTPTSKSNVDSNAYRQIRNGLAAYLERFCEIAFVNAINCGPILNWFEIDNKGNRLFAIDDSPINIPGVAAAVVKKRYVAQSLDEISLEVGNMISVIDMPPIEESNWWRGKKALEVGFFPVECVELIKSNQHLSSQVTEHLPQVSQNQSVRLKHGKLITVLRGFFNTRPARMQLQSKGILKQRVFACDLGEHLSNTHQNVPKILKICTDFIEKYGMVDGIYRHTGLQSNIQRLRNAFDEEKWSEIESETYTNDVHSVSSLLKMYFRELPNPLLTFQLYQKFIRAVNIEDKIIEIYDVVQQLPPPHYRTLVFLMQHLHKMSDFASETNMNTKNLAIVWAPNLLKSKEMEGTAGMQLDMLHSITLQANISEFLIANADTIFNDKFASLVRKPDHKSNIAKSYRPISVCQNINGGSKLLSLEEAQDKYRQVGPADIPKYHTVIEIPDKQKKKQKDKKSLQSTAATSNTNYPGLVQQPPANLQIQQQFETLQQQQNQLTSSASFHCVSTSNTTPTKQQQQQHTTSASNQSSNGGNSSPAFKSIFKNLRGSLKQQSTTSSSQNNININSETEIKSFSTPPNQNLNSVANSSSLIRTNSGNTIKNTPLTTSAYSINSPSTERKLDYSSCISQLQSAAALAKSSIQNSSSPGISTSSNTTPSASQTNDYVPTVPVLFRNNKFNQSIKSNHSSNNISTTLNANQEVLSSFLISSSDSNTSNSQTPPTLFSTFNKADATSSSSDQQQQQRRYENNPIPSKRRTIQVPPTNSSASSFQKPAAQVPQPTVRTAPPTIPSAVLESDKENQQETNDEMQELVAYINKFEKENISNAVNVAQNNAYIDLTSEQIEKLSRNMEQETEPKTLVPDIDENEPLASKLRLSSSSLSSSDESLGDVNAKKAPSDIQSNVMRQRTSSEDQVSAVISPDRRTYVINKIYDNIKNEMEDDHELNTKDLNGQGNEDDQYEKVVFNNNNNYNNEDATVKTNENIYQNVNSEDLDDIRCSLGFDVNAILEEKIKNTNSGNRVEGHGGSDTEKSQDENFDNELIELNNQIKQLLITNEPTESNVKSKSVGNSSLSQKKEDELKQMNVPIKPRPSTRPKSVNYQNTRKPCAPAPPSDTDNSTTKQNTPNKQHQQSLGDLENLPAGDNRCAITKKSSDKLIAKSTSIDEIKHQQEYSRPIKQQVRHSFRITSTDPVKVFNQNNEVAKSVPLPNKAHEMIYSNNPEEKCGPKKTSPIRKQRKAVNVKAPEKQDIQIETINNLEELSVKAKIKLMDSFVGTKPISIDKKNERSSSMSSNDSSSSSSSSSVSKSPLISPKDSWTPPQQCELKFKQPNQQPSVMVRAQVNLPQGDSNIQSSQVSSSRSMTHMSNKCLPNEYCGSCDESESVSSLNKPKQTLIECMNKKADNILASEFGEVEEIFERISFDKVTNDILLTKPSQQALATLKEKRRTVKELMSKFEKN